MRVQIVARRCEIPSSLRARAEEQVQKLSRFDPRVSSAEVVFEEERHLKKAEGILAVDRATPVVAQGQGTEFGAALDQMVERLSRILRRRRDQVVDHQAPKLSEVTDPGE